jgi:hypothetical protein
MRFCTTRETTLHCMQLRSLQISDGSRWLDITGFETREETAFLFGEEPGPNAAFCLGLNGAGDDCLPVASDGTERVLSLHIELVGPGTGRKERERILEEARWKVSACPRPSDDPRCREAEPSEEPVNQDDHVQGSLRHHDVRTVWEYATIRDGDLIWLPLTVDDRTRALTLTGFVHITLPEDLGRCRVGECSEELYYLRCSLADGTYDAPPRVARFLLNAVEIIQAIPLAETLTVDKDAIVVGPPPAVGSAAHLNLSFNEDGEIRSLVFDEEESNIPAFTLLEFAFSPGKAGRLTVEAVTIGSGTGAPNQKFTILGAPVVQSTIQLYTLEAIGWRHWELRSDFAASKPGDLHFMLNPSTGEVTFGDGDRGCVPPPGSRVVVFGSTTMAEGGNVAAAASWKLADSSGERAHRGTEGVTRNEALLILPDEIAGKIARIECPAGASGGEAAETLSHAIGRTIADREAVKRAVTLEDLETLARQTPGARLARVAARANLHPRFPCLHANGLITVIIIPHLPSDRPAPTAGLKRLVAAHLQRHRIIGTRVEVAGPDYLEIAVRSRVRAFDGIDLNQLRRTITDTLSRFLHPLAGGPEGDGWPFGRDVYRAEIMQVIDELPGVDNVISLDLVPNGCEGQCGNVCLLPTSLVVSGHHEIEIVRGNYASA